MKRLIKKIANSDALTILLLIVVSVGSIYYLLLPGFYEPQDLHHIGDIYQMYRAIISGQIPPRWGPDFLYSYGYPLFNFYYVGPFYLGALFYFITGSLRFSFELVFISGVLIGTIGLYLFLKEHFSKLASFCGAVLFTYTPYKAVQIYVRGAMGEFLSLSLMPLLLYFSGKFLSIGERKWFVFSVIISALIILSHNYFWVVILGFCGLYFAIESIVKKKLRILGYFVLEIIFSLGITAYWWLPALIEQKLLKIQTPFPLIDHFPFVKQLIVPFWGYGASVWGPNDGMSFQLGIVNILVVIASVIIFLTIRKKRTSSIFLWSFLGMILCLFFMNIRSYFIWRVIPFYNLFQFPWRLLSFTTFFSSVLAACVVERLTAVKKMLLGKLAGFLIIILSFLFTISYFKPSQIFYKSDNDYLNRMFADITIRGYKSTVGADYLNWSEDYLLLPKWLKGKPKALPPQKFISADEGEISVNTIREISAVNWKADVEVKKAGKLNFYSLYFPGWYASVNGKNVDISPGESGQIVIALKEGDTEVEVYWSEINLRRTADIITLVSVFILLMLLVIKKPLIKNVW